jgi:hypothetical protein
LAVVAVDQVKLCISLHDVHESMGAVMELTLKFPIMLITIEERTLAVMLQSMAITLASKYPK